MHTILRGVRFAEAEKAGVVPVLEGDFARANDTATEGARWWRGHRESPNPYRAVEKGGKTPRTHGVGSLSKIEVRIAKGCP